MMTSINKESKKYKPGWLIVLMKTVASPLISPGNILKIICKPALMANLLTMSPFRPTTLVLI